MTASVEILVRDARLTDIDRVIGLMERADARWTRDKLTDAADILRQMLYLPNASVIVALDGRLVVGAAALTLRPSVATGGMVGTVDITAVEPGNELDGITRGTARRNASGRRATKVVWPSRALFRKRPRTSRAGRPSALPSQARACAARWSAFRRPPGRRHQHTSRAWLPEHNLENHVSKNVAVFVDVANIFYAAKAAGVDIDYVTLLKSATANRDFVRAYAYTGLDPENENQRQFHSFLARSGYKVISKDIRKYGDGRIKANLDIELVVDLMKTARNLDIAVVVSGDGDFAPAIRAVQEMGVRCEVISFRGNTSSDLIEVADQFTDIAQIARVEKGSVRSGRRVAAEGDLSMTEVPEKETEGAPRRRRGGRTTREERVEEPAVEALPGNLVVLPGERLSRAPEDGEDVEELEADIAAAASSANGSEPAQDGDVIGEDGRRRRRRRGGRGRGRGRQAADGTPIGDEPVTAQSGEEDEEFEDVATRRPASPSHVRIRLGQPARRTRIGPSELADDDVTGR